jgi:hypothetical protein
MFSRIFEEILIHGIRTPGESFFNNGRMDDSVGVALLNHPQDGIFIRVDHGFRCGAGVMAKGLHR